MKEYLDLRKAKALKKKFDLALPTGVECRLTYECGSYQPWTLTIKNSYGAVKELSESENDIKELLDIIHTVCRRYHCSFDYSKHGLKYIYINIEVR